MMSGGTGGSWAGKVLLVLGIILLPLLIIGGCMIGGYNKAIGLSEGVSAQWGQVENQLQRRFDLIPNLVETVKGYADREEKIFADVNAARKAYTGAAANSPERVKAAGELSSVLSRLLVINERYPDLKANQNFLTLQAQIEGSENRLSQERRRYNMAVRELNTYCRKFFGRMITGWAGVEPAEYFEVPEEAKAVPKVDFGTED